MAFIAAFVLYLTGADAGNPSFIFDARPVFLTPAVSGKNVVVLFGIFLVAPVAFSVGLATFDRSGTEVLDLVELKYFSKSMSKITKKNI